jgi:hypothetical protein
MTGTLKLSLDLTTADPAVSAQSSLVRDSVATSHDLVDPTPRAVATSGAIGTAFVSWPTSVQQIERLIADVPAGADLVFRFGGLPAVLVGSLSVIDAPVAQTIVLAIDGADPVTTTLTSADTTIALVARRINFYHGAQVASVDPSTNRLRLTGVKTGGADAAAKGWSAGIVEVVSGSGLALVGLEAGTTYGSGDDQRVGAGLFAKTFPAASLPRLLELSGSATNLKIWAAGKAA